MTAPAKRPPSHVVPALLVLVALALILNPELRALLFLTNVIGFEVIGILLALQLRALIDLVPEMLRPAAFACNLRLRAVHQHQRQLSCRRLAMRLTTTMCALLIMVPGLCLSETFRCGRWLVTEALWLHR